MRCWSRSGRRLDMRRYVIFVFEGREDWLWKFGMGAWFGTFANIFGILALLPTMRTDQGDEFQLDMYLPSPQGTNEGRSSCWVCELWMCGMRLERLRWQHTTSREKNGYECDTTRVFDDTNTGVLWWRGRSQMMDLGLWLGVIEHPRQLFGQRNWEQRHIW